MLQKLEEYCFTDFENPGKVCMYILAYKYNTIDHQAHCLFNISDDSSGLIRDGHDIDEKDKFDRRQSLSYDVPTKFNDRLQSKNVVNNYIYQPGVTWVSYCWTRGAIRNFTNFQIRLC